MAHLSFKKGKQVKEYFELYDKYTQKYGKIALLYQMGSFYNIYGISNSKETKGNLTEICNTIGLTETRANKKVRETSMSNPGQCGMPVASVDNWVKKFIDFNYTVIIYSQTNPAGKEKMMRVLDKIISPGTFVESNEEASDTKSNNFICVYITPCGENIDLNIITLEMSTGKVNAYSIIEPPREAFSSAIKIIHTSNPTEILLYGGDYRDELELSGFFVRVIDDINPVILRHSYQNEFLQKVYPGCGQLSPIEYINFEFYPSLVIAYVLILQFAYEQDEYVIQRISKPTIVKMEKHIRLSYRTISQLNLTVTENHRDKSLFDIINFASTPMGKRLLKQRLLSPYVNPKIIESRYNEIEQMIGKHDEAEDFLSKISDIERLHRKMFLKTLQPSEFVALDTSYSNVVKLINRKFCREFIAPEGKEGILKNFKNFMIFYRKYLDLDQVAKFGLNNINAPIFKPGLYPEIDEFYAKERDAWSDLRNYAKELSEKIGEKDIVKIDATSSEGYYFSMTSKRYKALEAEIGKIFEVKVQSSNVKMWDPRVRTCSQTIIECRDNMIAQNRRKFQQLCEDLSSKYSQTLKSIANYVAHVDVVKSAAKCATLYNYCKPSIVKLDDYSYIDAKDMRHPILERVSQEDFVSNDINIGKNQNGILLYGLNGSGKSIYLKAVGLNIILAQAGFYVPCQEFTFSPFNTLITKISLSDDLYRGRSTFTLEMLDLRDMLEYGGKNTMVLGDEVCHGTEHESALAIVSAAIDSLMKKGCCFIFTSHLHQLTTIDLIKNISNLRFSHLSVEVIDGKVIYGRKLLSGSGPSSYGLLIATQLNVGDSEFQKTALSIQRDLQGKHNQLLSTKQSKYNPDVYVHECSVCGDTKNLETDHIQRQELADENNMIEGYHKNRKGNLQILCRKCHEKKTLEERK